MTTPRKPRKPRKPRQPKKRPAYNGGMTEAQHADVQPYAVCPRCLRLVKVSICLGYELFAHRGPNPGDKVCDTPMKVRPASVIYVAAGEA